MILIWLRERAAPGQVGGLRAPSAGDLRKQGASMAAAAPALAAARGHTAVARAVARVTADLTPRCGKPMTHARNRNAQRGAHAAETTFTRCPNIVCWLPIDAVLAGRWGQHSALSLPAIGWSPAALRCRTKAHEGSAR